MPSTARPHPVLRVIVRPIETGDAQRLWDEAIDAFCEALADRAIAKARAQVAAELGVDEASIDRERGRVTEEAEEHGAHLLGGVS